MPGNAKVLTAEEERDYRLALEAVGAEESQLLRTLDAARASEQAMRARAEKAEARVAVLERAVRDLLEVIRCNVDEDYTTESEDAAIAAAKLEAK